MKKIYLITIFIFAAIINIYATMPDWVRNPPKSNNPNQYRYAVVEGKGRSENEARLDAEERIMENCFMSLGCKDRKEIDHWLASGIWIDRDLGKVYVKRDKEGTFSYFQLYIYASKANTRLQYSCDMIGIDKPDLGQYKTPNTRPSYWSNYEDTEKFFSLQSAHTYRKGEVLHNTLDSLYKVTEEAFMDKYRVFGTAEDFSSLVCNDYYYDKKSKEVHAIAYVKKTSLKNLYINKISYDLTITLENLIKDIQSFDTVAQWDIALATCYKTQEFCNEIIQSIERLSKLIGETPIISYYTEEINIKRQILRDKMGVLQKKDLDNSHNRLIDILYHAQKAEKERKLGTVLKYYYGALAYAKRYNELNNLSIYYDYSSAAGRPWGIIRNDTTQYILGSWLPEHIKRILRSVKIKCYQDKTDAYKIHLLFYWPDNTPVVDGHFCFNINKGEGWSWPHSIESGKGYFEKIDCPKQFDIRLEYRYIDDWHSDEAIRNVVKNAKIDFDIVAMRHITIEEEPIVATESQPIPAGSEFNIVAESDEVTYRNIISKVCSAINNKRYDTLKNIFTANGYEIFMRLVRQGNVSVKDISRYELYSYWDEVYARSIKMTIQYTRERKILTKNVIFVFDRDKKISGIQFAIDPITKQSIDLQDNWDDNMKYAVLNFIENYQTAFTLKRLDYIQSVFSDDAVIIVGYVVPVPIKLSDGENINFKNAKSQEVKYYNLSKAEYLKRLERVFASNEWININFANIEISQQPNSKTKSMYGLGLKQDYSSQHYGDTGYLFLVVDMKEQQKPIIHLRVWTPEADFGWPQYMQMLKEEQDSIR